MSEKQITLTVTGMTCMGCAGAVKGAISRVEGVREVEVTLDGGLVDVTYDQAQATPEQFSVAVVDAGYGVSG